MTAEQLDRARRIIEGRVKASGVAEPVVDVDDALLRVGVPGFAPESEVAQKLRTLIGTTGVLEFTPVPVACAPEVLPSAPQPACLDEVEPLLDGTEIAAARIGQDVTTDELVINIEFYEAAARLLDEHAGEHLFEQFAIVLDGIVESAPSINATHFGGQVTISGGFTLDEAVNLIAVLQSGSLPLEFRELDFGDCGDPA